MDESLHQRQTLRPPDDQRALERALLQQLYRDCYRQDGMSRRLHAGWLLLPEYDQVTPDYW